MSESQTTATDLDVAEAQETAAQDKYQFAEILFKAMGVSMDRAISASLELEAGKPVTFTVRRFVSFVDRTSMETLVERFEVVKKGHEAEIVKPELVERVVVGSSGRCNTCGEPVLWTAPLSTSQMRGRCACGVVSPQARPSASPPPV